MNRKVLAALLALVAAIAGLSITVTTPDEPQPPASVTVPVDGLDPGKTPDSTITAPKAAVTAIAPKLEAQLQNELPAAASTDELGAAVEAAAKIAATQPPLPTAGATAGFAGCRTSFVRNQSSRRGVRPQVQVLHYTVSPNRPGWSDINSIIALFDRASRQASSNFIIDTEGHCAYIVPIEAKAWTQAAGNPFSISYEIIATGNEPRYLQPPGMRKLRSVVHEVARRTGIPLRAGRVSNCTSTRTGLIDHRAWGTCGGGHIDISPFPVTTVVAQLVADGTTPADRRTCQKINAWRRAGRPPGGDWERNTVRRRQALERRGVTCTTRGPVK